MQRKPLIASAREAVQTAEDAREIAVKRIEADRLAAERQASSDAQARSQAQADDATRLKEKAQSDAAMAQARRGGSATQCGNSSSRRGKVTGCNGHKPE